MRFCRRLFLLIALLHGGVFGMRGQDGGVNVRAQVVDTTRAPSLDARPDSAGAAVQSRLEAIFRQVEAFRGIEVRVRDGIVHLSGTVVQPGQAGEAVDLARQLDGVLYVENNISAETDLADRVTPALSRLQSLGTAAVQFLPVGLIALSVVLVTIGVARWVGHWGVPQPLRSSPLAWGMVRRVLQVVTTLIGLVVVFDLLGVTSLVGALLGTAGVAGLAVGFAFRDIIENYLAGVILSIRQPFRGNDIVAIADHEGRVVRLTAREVILLTFEGNHVRIPNATVFKNVLVNYTLNAKRLFYFDVSVGNEKDLQTVQDAGVETLDAMRGVLPEPPPFARIQELGDSSVVIRFHGWVDQEEADFHKVQSEAHRLVKQALDEADAEMPEPTYRLRPYRAGDAPLHAPNRPEGSLMEHAQSIDVHPDGRLEEVVEEELRTSDEQNLLTR